MDTKQQILDALDGKPNVEYIKTTDAEGNTIYKVPVPGGGFIKLESLEDVEMVLEISRLAREER